jgi:DNA-binding transcriptional regulator PaaX
VRALDVEDPGVLDAVNANLLAQIRLVDEWRWFPLADPDLPRELLPPDWIGARAAAVFGGTFLLQGVADLTGMPDSRPVGAA